MKEKIAVDPDLGKPFMSNKLYDSLKFLAQILLPALGTLYFALAAIWGLPAAEQVMGTIIAIDAFLGVVLGISTRAYNNSDARYDGSLDVVDGGDKKLYSLNLEGDPAKLDQKDEVRFKVNPSIPGGEG